MNLYDQLYSYTGKRLITTKGQVGPWAELHKISSGKDSLKIFSKILGSLNLILKVKQLKITLALTQFLSIQLFIQLDPDSRKFGAYRNFYMPRNNTRV